MFILRLFFVFPVFFTLLKCNSKEKIIPLAKKRTLITPIISQKINEKQFLSQYEFFKGKLKDLKPNNNVYPYSLNTPLFSNYAFKKRFIYLPEGRKIIYKNEEVFSFEAGTVLIKNFYYPADFRNENGEKKIIETRLLIKESNGWKALNYLWGDDQKDASLNYIGKQTMVSWTHTDGSIKSTVYNVPNNNQCKNCHLKGKDVNPIGPSAAQLNKKYAALSTQMSQLEFFKYKKLLVDSTEHADFPKFAIWDQEETGNLEDRAKAYLDINCAHCHNPKGSAKNSGLDLRLSQLDMRKQGIYKPPVAAGKGSGNLEYNIVPGRPEESILIYRIKSNDPGVMMPEIGRSIIHKEGVALIEKYIQSLNIYNLN